MHPPHHTHTKLCCQSKTFFLPFQPPNSLFSIKHQLYGLWQGTSRRDNYLLGGGILGGKEGSGASGLSGGHGLGYMGLAATTWVPMGAGVPVFSPNDNPNPS